MLSSAQWRCLVWQSKWFFDCWFRIYFSGPVWGFWGNPNHWTWDSDTGGRKEIPSLKLTVRPWKLVVGTLLSFWGLCYVCFYISSNKTCLSRWFSFSQGGICMFVVVFWRLKGFCVKIGIQHHFLKDESAIHFFHREGDWTYKHVATGHVSMYMYISGTLRIAMQHMGVSKNRGTPKWMVYNGKPY